MKFFRVCAELSDSDPVISFNCLVTAKNVLEAYEVAMDSFAGQLEIDPILISIFSIDEEVD